jgi:uncharacterized protein YndB with AHSA1/START domain
VFKAWADPQQMTKWFGCSKVSGVKIEQDFRVGGQYTIEAINCETNESKTVTGTYKEIVPNKKLVFSWTNKSIEFPAIDTLVTVEFIEKNGKTEVVVKHTNFALTQSVPPHTMGWTECLDKLAALVA